ncbi:MAG: RecQ family ATP-dependent DNA helicase [Deltaproteobacteria bacterium]|nr:RecQ family ATP-dependent DNA helicase [Deltaproteobacteria bacterium]MBM4322267.1 RecQ family ATP-dependent DNA helicase [Deltaproteobacteria bacterium]MBM4346906.1 RecQ family ATP-dependent DNA helicase [Deltaproteobacteria bacterium]
MSSPSLNPPPKDERFRILSEKFHFSEFRKWQEEIIDTLLKKRDAVVIMPTGSGKSLCYQLPALLLDGVTLVISPLIALMKDQVDGLVENQIPATFINSTLTPSEQWQRLREIQQGRYKLVYIAPERFRNSGFMEGIQSCRVSLFAVDEAHCVSEWGHDFRPDYLRLKGVAEKLGHPPVAALTATATPDVRRDIITQLGLRQPITFVAGFDRPNLRFQIKEVAGEEDKIDAILALLRKGGQRGIIYAATRKNVDAVTQALILKGYKVGGYHAGMEIEARKSVQDRFMEGILPMVVATNAFGMGIDKADLRFVIHYDIPGSLEAYYQEVGRAGRDGKPATCLLLFNYADTFTQEFFIEGSYPPQDMIEQVYEVICDIGTDEIEMTQKALAARLSYKKSNEMAVSSCLKILEKAGYIERGSEGEHQARVTLRAEPGDLQRQVEGKSESQKEIVNYCLDILNGSKDRTLLVDLDMMAEHLNLSQEQLRRNFSLFHQAGTLEYRPPFRGRGLKVLSRVPVSELNISFQEIERRSLFERKKLKKMVDYAYTDECLRRFILEYFGERIVKKSCENCSTCLGESETHPFRTHIRKERMVKEKPFRKFPEKLSEELDMPFHEDLFDALKEMRFKLAQASNLPAFVIFHDRVLKAISQRLPRTTAELLSIKGCGEYKVSAYGNQTLEVVRAYLKDHPEAKPLYESDGSAAVQHVAKKTTRGSTVEITWMLWEKGGTPKEIAQKRGLTTSTISEHLVQLIGEGRSIDLHRILSRERIGLIEEAIVRAGSERLAPIRALLPQDVTYDEIRLVLGQYIQKAISGNIKR